MSESEDDGVGSREVAFRLFASEFEDADFSYAESDEERAPNYVITPTGARVNRLFVVGVLTEVQRVGDDVLRARVVDPTGAFVVYAGQYQPEAQTFLERADPPTFVAVSGKARTFQPDDSDVIYTSIRPESVNEVDADTRDRWVVQTAEHTLDRIGAMAAALRSDTEGEDLRSALADADVDEALASGIPLALDHYGTGGRYLEALRETAVDAARVVAGELDEVDVPSIVPDAAGEADLASLAAFDLEAPETGEPTSEPVTTAAEVSSEADTADSRAGAAGAETSTAESEAAEVATTSDDESPTETAQETAEATGAEPETSTSETAAEATAQSSEPPTASAESVDDGADTESADTDAGPGDFDPGEFELDEETREEVESEYGTDFQSGTEVEEPGEADIDTPDPEELDEAASAGAPVGAADAESAPESTGAPAGDESATPSADAATSDAVSETPATDTDAGPDETAPEADETTAGSEGDEDADLEEAVMDAMRDLDDGDGADREELVATVVEETGVDPAEVEDAIQDALMNGQCYEPDDTTLKPI